MADEKEKQAADEQVKEKEAQREAVKEFAWKDFKAMLSGAKLYDGRSIPAMRWYLEDDIPETKRFLQDPDFASERYTLGLRLKLLKQLLAESSSHEDAKMKAEELAKKARELLEKNLGAISEKTRDLERKYRTFALFVDNAQMDPNEKLNVTLLNANQDELFEPDSDGMKELAREVANYGEYADYKDRAYGMLLIPGHHFRKDHVGALGALLKNNRMMLLTDAFGGQKGFNEAEDYLERLQLDQFKSIPDASHEKRHMIVTVNELVGRDKEKYEKEDVHLPSSAALAGLIYYTDNEEGPHVTPAGEIKGDVKGAARPKVVFNAKDHGTMSRELNLIPLAFPRDTLRFMGARSLCSGEEFKFFAVSRVYDMICNVLSDFSKGVEFRNWDGATQNRLEHGIRTFLNALTGPGKPLKSWSKLETYEDTSSGEAGVIRVKLELQFNMPIEKVLFELPVKLGEDTGQ
ncbi:MAG: hypothetical protein KAY32_10390 [Candidatus Eisenbacteria sp.]|nr:hypothetical protein [Candidatus Eisenbacteria bacterium]